MAASKGLMAMARCSPFRNHETAGSRNPRASLGCFSNKQLAMHSVFYEQSHAGAVKTYCGKKNKLEKQQLKGLSALYDGSLSDKRRMKLLELVSIDLSSLSNTFSEGEVTDKSLAEVRGQIFSDAVQAVKTQLEQVKAERKQMKKEMKAQKKAVKAQKRLQKKKDEDDSSLSFESSDSQCEVVNVAEVGMTRPDKGSMTQIVEAAGAKELAVLDLIPIVLVENPTDIAGVKGLHREFAETKERLGLSGGEVQVQVCMGGKCKKSGSEQLLAVFVEGIQKSGMGCEIEAVGCKCMGKCRSAPNVRVQNDFAKELHMDVGIEDVDFVLSHHFGLKPWEDEIKSTDFVPV